MTSDAPPIDPDIRYRKIDRVIPGQPTSDGAGVRLTRYIGSQSLSELDPFLLLDFFESDNPDDYLAGFPSHPHRGFETVTYLLAGKMRHQDSAGHNGVIEAGGVQWMTAGRGIVHSEMPEQENGRLAGFQLWVNLPATEKYCEPAYHEYPQSQVPVEKRGDGVVIRVITGHTSGGISGPVSGIATRPLYLDVALSPGAQLKESTDEQHAAFIFVIQGQVDVIADQERSTLVAAQLGVLSEGNRVQFNAGGSGSRFLLVAAQPLNEPIVRYGPFVMNTRAQIEQAVRDFNSGRF